ncbi:putative lipid II flippase FtsW [Patescibacteria group bacterium]|nr:putative lipid II flippase FtsW [Patescibacteria group bacterium]
MSIIKTATPKSADFVLIALTAILVLSGFLIFASASLGQLARGGASYSAVATSQLVFGIMGGSIALFIMSNIYYRNWRQYAFYIYSAAIVLTLAVFIPGIGMSHGGATRWLDLGITTFQPAELLKIGYIIYVATWLSGTHRHIDSWRYGVLPFVGISAIAGVVLLLQPDTDTFLIMAAAGAAMFVVSGGRWRDIAILAGAAVLLLVIVAFMRPYVMDRITTFMDSDKDPLGSGYQIQQSLIAVGSGGLWGRGYGQSIQKFEYLPEPIGDSIFAVFAEEFGFLGSTILVLLITGFVFRGLKIATQAADLFGTLIIVGLMTAIALQAFLNIGAMIGLAPVSGLPLPFISHGGTALFTLLAALGIVLNVSKYRLQKVSA